MEFHLLLWVAKQQTQAQIGKSFTPLCRLGLIQSFLFVSILRACLSFFVKMDLT